MINLNKNKKIYGSPIPFNEKSTVIELFNSDIKYLRTQAIGVVNDKSNEDINELSKIEILLDYANALILFSGKHFVTSQLQNEIGTCLIDIGFFYQNAALDMLQRAYDLPSENENAWTASGTYLKRGLGILEFLKDIVPNFIDTTLFKRLSEMIIEFKLIQQVGILVLSLTKLKKSLSNDVSNELDLQTNDLKDASKTSSFYAKLSVGCYETCIQLGRGRIINNSLSHYLEGLTYLLLSMDQYRKDECGVAIGLLEQCINSYSHIIPRSRLTNTIFSTPKIKTKTVKKFTNSLQSTFLKTREKSTKTFKIDNHDSQLLPVLDDSLENFIIPLISLLSYVYNHSNEKLFFQPVIRDELELKRLFPQGKSPQLDAIQWYFNGDRIEEYRAGSPSHVDNVF